jgi:signal transduction histidine kinase
VRGEGQAVLSKVRHIPPEPRPAHSAARLSNLIDNALAAIQPTRRIDVHPRPRNGYVQALVAGDGPGLLEDQRQRIFERFVRLDPGTPGHGLGLAIAQRIAHQHHGDLTGDPTSNGASFSLSVPTES